MSRMSFMTRMRPRAFRLSLAVFIIVIVVAAPEAAQQYQSTSYSADGAAVPTTATSTIDLLVGRSTVLNVTAPIARLSLTVPDIADAMVTSPQQILIHGKAPGTISMFVWDKAGAIRTYEVAVRRDLSVLSNQLRQLFPGETITVSGSGKDVVLSGRVSTPYIVEKAAEVAIAYADKKENVVNLLKMQEGVATNQVMLRVRFAEVSRSAVQELGSSFFTGPGGFRDYVAQTSTQQFPSINYEELVRESAQGPDKWGGGRDTVTATGGKFSFSDLLNLMLFNNRYNVGTIIRALSNKGLFQSLAEPNLVAMDGKEASFLAGGEFPFPVATPSQGGGYAVTVMFKEFGVRLNFTPTILGDDMVRLKVRPEVSALDFTNSVLMEGFRVPALSTRRTETEIELQNGQTFAIAGLMNNTLTSSMSKIPGIGDIPILGLLFRSKAHQKNQTELVVMITPYIVRRGSSGVSEGLPNLVEPYLGAPNKAVPPPAPYTNSPRYGTTHQGNEATIQPPQAPASSPAKPGSKPAASGQVAPPADPKVSKAEAKRLEMERDRQQMERELEAKRRADAEAAAGRVAAEQQKAAAKAAAEKQRADAKAAAEEQKRQEAAARAALKKAQEEQEKLEAATREQAKKDAAAAKKAGEDKKKAEEQEKRLAAEEAKRQKALAEAASKLKEAQSAYEAVVRTTPGKPLP